MIQALVDYFRCREEDLDFSLAGTLSQESGYFRLGQEICYGKYSNRAPAESPGGDLMDASCDLHVAEGRVSLPFDPDQVADSLRNERYAKEAHQESLSRKSPVARAYYFIRPLLPVAVRKHIQRIYFNGWRNLPFPQWPVDRTVDSMFERLLLLAIRAKGVERMPFIWFWPDGAPSCATMTHDVETIEGRDFCATLMDVNDSFGIKSSFQVIPERRYEVPAAFLDSIRNRGFEVNVHDLNHDGHLFRDRKEFQERAEKINHYGAQFGAQGFRSAVLYRRQDWLEALRFSYDSSVPNVAHLDPQRGGCCTVMPYFIGDLVELPVTVTQDYSLFFILQEYSIDLWKLQTRLILEKHGLMNFIVHPDYIVQNKERATYEALLAHLAELRDEKGVWIPLPGEVNRWWRQRAAMRLVSDGGGWRIEGSGCERAQVAYASEQDGRLAVALDKEMANGSAATRVRRA